MRAEIEIRKELAAAYEVTVDDGSNVPGMSYEEGVAAALSWAIEDNSDRPISDH